MLREASFGQGGLEEDVKFEKVQWFAVGVSSGGTGNWLSEE